MQERELAEAFSKAYSCGHCNSYSKQWTDEEGKACSRHYHDDGCPVLNGTVSDLPDVMRAAEAAGCVVVVIDGRPLVMEKQAWQELMQALDAQP